MLRCVPFPAPRTYSRDQMKTLARLWGISFQMALNDLPIGARTLRLDTESNATRVGYLLTGTASGVPIRLFIEDGAWFDTIKDAFEPGIEPEDEPALAAIAIEAMYLPALSRLEEVLGTSVRIHSLELAPAEAAPVSEFRFVLDAKTQLPTHMVLEIEDVDLQDALVKALKAQSATTEKPRKTSQQWPIQVAVLRDLIDVTRSEFDALAPGDGILLNGDGDEANTLRLSANGTMVAKLDADSKGYKVLSKTLKSKTPKAQPTNARDARKARLRAKRK